MESGAETFTPSSSNNCNCSETELRFKFDLKYQKYFSWSAFNGHKNGGGHHKLSKPSTNAAWYKNLMIYHANLLKQNSRLKVEHSKLDEWIFLCLRILFVTSSNVKWISSKATPKAWEEKSFHKEETRVGDFDNTFHCWFHSLHDPAQCFIELKGIFNYALRIKVNSYSAN